MSSGRPQPAPASLVARIASGLACAVVVGLGLIPLVPRPAAGMGLGAADTALSTAGTALGNVGGTAVGNAAAPLCPAPAITFVHAEKLPGAPDPLGTQAGVSGTLVHINGTNLMAAGCTSIIMVDTTTQNAPQPTTQDPTPPVDSATDLYFSATGVSGRVTVTLQDVANGQAVSNGNFTFIAPPTVTGLSSQSVVERSHVDVNGSGFSLGGVLGGAFATYYRGSAPVSGSSAVACNEQTVTDASLSDTDLTMTAPSTYCSGQAVISLSAQADTTQPLTGTNVSVVTAATPVVTVIGVVTTVSPDQPSPGDALLISGSGFGSSGTVTLNGQALGTDSWTDHALRLSIPTSASSGPLTINRSDGSSIAAGTVTLAPVSLALPGAAAGGAAGSGLDRPPVALNVGAPGSLPTAVSPVTGFGGGGTVAPGLSTIVPNDLRFAPTPINITTFALLAMFVLIAAVALGFINASRLIGFAWRARRAAARLGAAVVEPLTGGGRGNRARSSGRRLHAAGKSDGPAPLGHVLLTGRVIDRHQLRTALERQRDVRRPLGEILVSLGMATEEQIWASLSAQWGTSLGDLKNHWVDPALARVLPCAESVKYGMLPLRAIGDSVVMAMADPYDNHARACAERRFGSRIVPVLARPSAIRTAQGEVYADTVLEDSIAALQRSQPDASAHILLTKDQKIAAAIIAAGALLLAIVFGGGFFIGVAAAIIALYAVVVSFRTWVIVRGAKFQDLIQVGREELDALTDLPIYTILCPLYREAGVLPQLVKACADLDYPPSLLDVKLLLEADDIETLDVVRSFDLPSYFDVVVVPAEGPRTKPKACNYGLQFARGEYVVIFDAEDIPEPDQLKKAIATFRRSGPNVGCVQAKLNFYNPRQNILTGWFTLEYTSWFDFFLPGLVDLGLPVPLGGSSNHFPTSLLRELQAWDPNNVTEDADLGMRLHRAGYRTVIVDSTTFEEANSDFVNWVKQRSRWGKGYAVSWLVQMRHPRRLYSELGLKGFVAVQLTLGGTFGVALLNLAVWMLTLLWILAQFGFIAYLFPTAIYYVGMIELVLGNFFFMYVGLWSAQHRKAWELSRAALVVPIYWLMMSLAMLKALIQLFTRPGYWEKTVHGLFETQALQPVFEPALEVAGVAYSSAEADRAVAASPGGDGRAKQ